MKFYSMYGLENRLTVVSVPLLQFLSNFFCRFQLKLNKQCAFLYLLKENDALVYSANINSRMI